MFHLFTKRNKKFVFWILVILVVPTFVLWGGSFGSGGGNSAREQQLEVVAKIGETPIFGTELRQALDRERERRRTMGQEATYADLLADGTVDDVIEALSNQKLIAEMASSLDVQFGKKARDAAIQKSPEFQTETGEFDAAKYNRYIEQNSDMDWTPIYARIDNMLRQQLVAERLVAPAFVLESQVREAFEEQNTKIVVSYVTIDPEITLTDEQIQAYYDENTARYELPSERLAVFVAIPLNPEMPAAIQQAIERAGAGEDFAALAKELSQGPYKEDGGDLGWVSDSLMLPPHQKVLFEVPVGSVSEPVLGPGGYYVFKVEEEETSEVSNLRQVKARQIFVPAVVSEEARAAAQDTANALLAKAAESGDFNAAAAELGLEAVETGQFSPDTLTIQGVAGEDRMTFQNSLRDVEQGALSEVINAPRHVYVAKVTEVAPPVVPPLEEVLPRVTQDAIAAKKQEPEEIERRMELAREILANAKSISDIQRLFPELKVQPKTTAPFGPREFMAQNAPMWNPDSVIAALQGKPLGSFAGPISDFTGAIHFVELEERVEPDEATLEEQWATEKEQVREQLLARNQQAVFSDQLLHLRSQYPFQRDTQAILGLLDMDGGDPAPGEAPSPEAALDLSGDGAEPAPDADAADAGAEAPAAEAPAAE